MAQFVQMARRSAVYRAKSQLPEMHLIVAWLGSLIGFCVWLRSEMHVTDAIVLVSVYLLCLPVIFRRTTQRLLACLGSIICGCIVGMQLIDMCFDLCILRNGGDLGELEARRMAYFYYRTVLNSSHVNAALLTIILVSFLGSLVGLGRSSPEVRRRWVILGLLMFVGTGGYLTCVMPRYLVIRSSTAFSPRLFDNWETVVAARLVLFASILGSLPNMFAVQVMGQPEVQSDPLDCKRHGQ